MPSGGNIIGRSVSPPLIFPFSGSETRAGFHLKSLLPLQVSDLFKSMSNLQNNNGTYFPSNDGDTDDEDVKIIIKKGDRSIELVL